ncbi:adenylyl-sulfate kinase [Pseudomonas aegrilactucae]|uniref:adenylyl-sulfate kinase n=1 Tax=Pseudomonas aegrilactucae TaxID=2854028 RepID=UPI0020D20329|nr:adenylyl-sulfate kinase [Pseudomonas aegrilactucae]
MPSLCSDVSPTLPHTPNSAVISRQQHEARNGHRAFVVLLTGLPACGKSSLAQALHAQLFARDVHSLVLDGDVLRNGLSRDLGFSNRDREENIRRAAELAALLLGNGQVVILAMIAPLVRQRALLADRLGEDFIEVWCNAPLAVCEQRDPKGHYARARAGRLPGLTGVSAPYEAPQHAAMVIETGVQPLAFCVQQLLGWLQAHGRIPDA